MIVANTTFRIAPWADLLFAMDRQWWDVHKEEVALTFRGERVSSNTVASKYQVKKMTADKLKTFQNSGAGCVSLAVLSGAEKVIMLGYDCQKTEGQAHWHGDHPKGLGNAGSIDKWPGKFKLLAAHINGKAKVINASRVTALDMFERQPLEQALA